MSVKIMSMVFDRFPMGGNERLLALALADHANDDGANIHPGFERLAKKVMVSERTVIRLIQRLVDIGWLIKMTTGNSVRGIANLYRISPDWIAGKSLPESVVSGDKLSPQSTVVSGDKKSIGVTTQVNLGDTAVSYQHQEPSIQQQHRARGSEQGKPASTPHGELACRLIPMGVQVSSMHPTLLKWVDDGIAVDMIVECVAIARQQKPLPEKIPANYLDKIIRSELAPKQSPPNWMTDDNAAMRYGEEIGVLPKAGESWSDYRQRLRRAA